MTKEKIDAVIASMERLDDEELMNKLAVLFDDVESLESKNRLMGNLIHDMVSFISSVHYQNDIDEIKAASLLHRADLLALTYGNLRA